MKNKLYPQHTSHQHKFRSFLSGAFLFACAFTANAQTMIADWDATGITGFGPSPWAPTTYAPYLTYGGLTRGADVTTAGTAATNGWGGDGWTGTTGGEIYFTLTADADYLLTVDSMDISFMRDATGPAGGPLEYSINGSPFMVAYYLGFVSTDPTGYGLPTLDLTAISDLQHIPGGSTLTFRITPDPNIPTGSNGPLFLYNSPFGFHGCKGLRVFGKVEPTCATPSMLYFTGLTDDGVTISWPTISTALGYEYAYDDSLDPPTGWTYTTSNSVTLSGLDANTQYYFYVRSVCSGSDTSLYTGGGFLTEATTGILSQEMGESFFNVYPNPLDDQLNIRLGENIPANGTITLTDMTGKIHLQTVTSNNQIVLNVSGLAGGAYLLRYSTDLGQYTSLLMKK